MCMYVIMLESPVESAVFMVLQGNVDRCNRVISHVDSTKANMFMVRRLKTRVSKYY